MGAEADVEPPSGPRTTSERTAVLDGELDRSLEEFDGLMLREQELLEQKRADNEETASGLGGGGGSSRGEGSGEQPTGGEDGGSGGGNAGRRVSAGGEQEISEQDKARTPPDVGDGSDDDIVARQLREAAQTEDDPELREKLWEEYRRYKQAGNGGS